MELSSRIYRFIWMSYVINFQTFGPPRRKLQKPSWGGFEPATSSRQSDSFFCRPFWLRDKERVPPISPQQSNSFAARDSWFTSTAVLLSQLVHSVRSFFGFFFSFLFGAVSVSV
jgi:hypothetical protein